MIPYTLSIQIISYWDVCTRTETVTLLTYINIVLYCIEMDQLIYL